MLKGIVELLLVWFRTLALIILSLVRLLMVIIATPFNLVYNGCKKLADLICEAQMRDIRESKAEEE